jgi:hypothetical protein
MTYIMALGAGLLFQVRFWSGWELAVEEERVAGTGEAEEEAIWGVVGEETRVVEEEVAMPLRMPLTHSISRGPIQATDRF